MSSPLGTKGLLIGQPGAWTVWLPKLGNGAKLFCGGKLGGNPFIKGMDVERLKPRGVPAVMLWLFIGKWPLLFASEREGAMCEGSRT